MRRRDFIKVIACSATGRPLVARTQQSTMAVIGLLQLGTPKSYDLSGFRQGLKEAGYIEGQNLTIEYRFANDDGARLPELAADLVRQKVRVIATVGSGLAAQVAKEATNTIPVVFGSGLDPIKQGIVASLNRPGGKVTGVISLANELYGKQLGILHELMPPALHFTLAFSRIRKTRRTQLLPKPRDRQSNFWTPAPAPMWMQSLLALPMNGTCRACWSATIRFSMRDAFN
jgi:putative tryptophan/tyrosine transport system substrate-binding protein